MLTRSNLFFLLIYFSKYPKSDGHGKETADIGVRETADTGVKETADTGAKETSDTTCQ